VNPIMVGDPAEDQETLQKARQEAEKVLHAFKRHVHQVRARRRPDLFQ
jgi:hypothetical protein